MNLARYLEKFSFKYYIALQGLIFEEYGSHKTNALCFHGTYDLTQERDIK